MSEARALRDKVLRVNAHVTVLKSQKLFADYREVTKAVEAVDGVVAVEPFLFLELLVASAGHAPVRFAMKGSIRSASEACSTLPRCSRPAGCRTSRPALRRRSHSPPART